MKILMWHCKNFDVKITGIADRPGTIQPEEQRSENEQMKNCIVSMITLEVQDNDSTVEKAKKEIIKFAEDTKSKNIVLMPFVHLSNNIENDPSRPENLAFISFLIFRDEHNPTMCPEP